MQTASSATIEICDEAPFLCDTLVPQVYTLPPLGTTFDHVDLQYPHEVFFESSSAPRDSQDLSVRGVWMKQLHDAFEGTIGVKPRDLLVGATDHVLMHQWRPSDIILRMQVCVSISPTKSFWKRMLNSIHQFLAYDPDFMDVCIRVKWGPKNISRVHLAKVVIKAIYRYLRTLHSRPVNNGYAEWSFRPKFNPLIDRLCLHRLWTPGGGLWFADLYKRNCAGDFGNPNIRSLSSNPTSEQDEAYDSDEVGSSDSVARRFFRRLPHGIWLDLIYLCNTLYVPILCRHTTDSSDDVRSLGT